MGYIETLRQLPDMVSPGVSACPGCGGELVLRRVLQLAGENTIVCVPPGCMAGSGAIGWSHNTGMKIPVHIPLLDNTASFMSGLSHIYERRGRGDVNIVAVAGDGATADCGFQSLSGAAERGEKMLYVCYDNEAYMNTGIQRSSSTPRFADATTSPAGTEIPGKVQNKKDLTAIIAAHNVPYAAQTTFIGNFKDLHEKARKAIYTEGPCFLNILSPCPRGWRYETEDLAEICQLAVDTCAWPMYEIIDGTWNLTYEPKKKLPIEEFLKKQGRFKHMFRKGNEWMIEETQKYVDEQWEKLLSRCR